MRLVVVTGVSGAGKSTALRALEDLGFYAVDNLPLPLVPQLIELLASRPDIDRTALGIDARSGNFLEGMATIFADLRNRGHSVEVLFLEATDEILIRRFSETRHRHPLADQRGIASSIAAERRLLDPVRSEADVVIDTSDLSLRELRERIFTRLGEAADPDRLAIQLISFGFKYGIPLEADLVFDVRFMQNPYYIEELRQLSGLTEAVRAFVLDQPVAQQFLGYLHEYLGFAIPAYVGEGKTRLTIALGCTGGYHRSIALTEALADWLREQDFGPIAIFHRELDRT